MRTFAVLALALIPCGVAACSSSDPKVLTAEAGQALAAGDAEGAVAKYERAIERLDTKSPEFLRASMGRFQALARTEPTRAAREFKAFQAAQASRVQDADFKTVIDELLARDSLTQATDVLEVAQRSFPDSPVVTQLVQRVGDAAKKRGDSDAMRRLGGMGYVGKD